MSRNSSIKDYDIPNTDPASLHDDDIEQDFVAVQETNPNNPSERYTTIHTANVGDSMMYTDIHPRVISGQHYQPSSPAQVSIFKSKNLDIIPAQRDLFGQYRKEVDRLKSFYDWPRDAAVRKEDLARNGFIYLHMKDRVQCVFCRGILSSWEPGDIVENEHKKFCPECPFAFRYECGNIPMNNVQVAVLPRQNVVAPPSALQNLPNISSQPDRRYLASVPPSPQVRQPPTSTYNTVVNHQIQPQSFVVPNANLGVNVRPELRGMSPIHTANKADTKGEPESLPASLSSLPTMPNTQSSLAQTQSNDIITSPKYKDWEREDLRTRSFKGWPTQMTQTPRELAAAGLLYMGAGDRCKCYWCGGELYDWEPEDEPWEEHAKWFPQCGYVREKKGSHFIQHVIDKQNGLVSDTSTQELMSRPHVLAVLTHGYTREQVEEVFNRFGQANLVDAPSIIRAIDQTKREREAAKSSQPSRVFQPVDHHEDVEMEDNTADTVTHTAVSGMRKLNSERPGSSCAVSSKTQKDVEQVLEENEKLKDQKMCKICMDNDVCIMFMPCKHLATCEDCCHSLKECPVCRVPINDRIKIFWA